MSGMMLRPSALLNAYAQGIFPMAHSTGQIYWYDPDPRAILPLDGLHIPRRLRQKINRHPYEIRFSSAFRTVMRRCAAPAPDRTSTWIDDTILNSYTALHQLGYAHSVEAWHDGEVVGGLYGVALRGLFAGESMFSRATDASKICLVYLVEQLRERGYTLLDVQYQTDHLARFGVVEISRDEYKRRLGEALLVDASFVD
jgi:leucyl/phenylalanyl-tRNA--protein transferase